MLQSTDGFPLNFGFTGKGNSSVSSGIAIDLEEQIQAGAIGWVHVTFGQGFVYFYKNEALYIYIYWTFLFKTTCLMHLACQHLRNEIMHIDVSK